MLLPLFIAMLAAASSTPALAQTGPEIVQEAMERFEERLAGVEDLRIRHEVFGVSVTAFMVKDSLNGRPILRPTDDAMARAGLPGLGSAADLWATPHRFYGELADRWVLTGRTTIDGQEVWTLILEDLDDLPWGRLAGHGASFLPERVELALSTDELLPLSMTMQGVLEAQDEARPLTLRVRLSEYREVNGYLHPFLTEIETDGTDADISDEDLEQARESLEQLRRELDRMPEERRAAMERLLEGQIQMLEDVIEEGTLRVEIRVTDLEANIGRPS